MPDQSVLPQYANPTAPQGINQSAISPMLMPGGNPLTGLASGITAGANLGLVQQQIAASQQQRAIEAYSAQVQAQQMRSKILLDAADAAHNNFDLLAKVKPDVAMDYYNSSIVPLHQQILGMQGIQMNPQEMPASHQNADAVKQIDQFVGMLGDPSTAKLGLMGLNKISNDMDLAEVTRKQATAGMDTGKQMQGLTQFGAEQTKTAYQQGQDAINKFNEDTKDPQKELVEAKTSDAQLDMARQNPIAFNLLPIKLARMTLGSSRINQNELSAATGENDLKGRFDQIIKQQAQGTLTNSNYNFMKQITGLLINANQDAINTYGQLHAKQLSQINNLPMEQNYQTLTGQPFVQGDPKQELAKKLGLQ